MSATSTGLFRRSSQSPWVVNQAVSSAEMVEKMASADLRRGDLAELDSRVRRIEELVNEHLLEPDHERRLLLLAARLLDAAGQMRKVHRIVGRLVSDDARLREPFYSELRRFVARLALNRGDAVTARYEIDRADRTVTETPEAFGRVREEVDREDISAVTAATWLLSAEVAISEGDFTRALQDLSHACRRMSSSVKSPDESAMFELLSALVSVRVGDGGGAPAVAHLYHMHVDLIKESPVGAATSARIAAAAGALNLVGGINQMEAQRWRGYGPEPALVESYLRHGGPTPPPASLLERLPAPEDFMQALDERLPSGPPHVEQTTYSQDASERFSSLPLSFLFADHSLDDVTSMFDVALKTGPLVVDWSACDRGVIKEAISGGAISEIAGKALRGTIYFNNGAYVDACFDSNDPGVLSLSPVDVIFEMFRIGMAGLPNVGAQQFKSGPQAARVPESINIRPNKLNIDLVRRFDELRRREAVGEAPEREDDGDLDAAFAKWDGSGAVQALPPTGGEAVVRQAVAWARGQDSGTVAEENGRETGAQARDVEGAEARVVERPSVAGAELFSPLLEVLRATKITSLCKAARACLASLGFAGSRIEVSAAGHAEPIEASGPGESTCSIWAKYPAGPLFITLAFPHGVEVGCPEAVDVVLNTAALRLRTIPGEACVSRAEVSGFVAADPVTQEMLSKLRDLSQLDGTTPRQKLKHILIVGERGTGKELIARAVHNWSRRNDKNFLAINLGAISKGLAASEIFGHKKGAFTGAVADRRGYIQDAEGGTLFLDEIDEADDDTQALLKRVVQEGTYNIVGSPEELLSDVRFVAATNRVMTDIPFIKEDLRDRFWEVRVPALRDRRGDIRPLAEFFASQYEFKLPEPVLEYLEKLDWPGNVRQLQNTVEKACALAKSPADLNLGAFERYVLESGGNSARYNADDPPFRPLGPGETLKDRQDKDLRKHIEYALRSAGGNRKHAADMLGRTTQWLGERMRALGIPDLKL